jgi:hypothetical protein
VTPDVGTEAVPRRKIPQKMWAIVADADRRAKFTERTVRQELIDIGESYGFSETDLVKRGIITPRENPNPEVSA